MTSVIQGGSQAPAQFCQRSGDFVNVPIQGADPTTLVVPTGTQGVQLNCSVIPSGNGYNVTVSAQITTGASPGQVTFTGFVTPRVRDANGNPNPTSDATPIPNIRGIFQDSTGVNLFQKDCYAQYTTADPALLTGSPLPVQADTYADAQGGRIWLSVFCPDAVNQNTGNQITKACQGTATFRFENCTSH